MALHTSQGKDNLGPCDPLRLVAYTSPVGRGFQTLLWASLPPSSKARALSLSSPSNQKTRGPSLRPKSSPGRQAEPAFWKVPAAGATS